MKLFINTASNIQVEVFLVKNDTKVATLIEENERGSQVLLGLIIKLVAFAGMTLQDLTEIEVDVGPGSYTGLKVGAAVGQALGFALNIPVNGQLNKPVQLRYS